MRSFSVKQIGARYVRISAPMRDYRGKYMGATVRYFDRETCELLSEYRFNEATQS
jgi:hypothetical protein